MTAIAASNVTFTKIDEDFLAVANKIVIMDIAFGNSSLTYPSGGIPLGTKDSLGFLKTLKYAGVQMPPTNGYIYKFTVSDSAPKIRIYQTASGSAAAEPSEVTTAYAPAATTVRVLMMGE